MSEEVGKTDILTADYGSPREAFEAAASELLTEATHRGVIDFGVNDIKMLEATGALNTVGAYIDAHPEEDLSRWSAVFRFIDNQWSSPDFRSGGPFGVEAQLVDGVVEIWWPN